LKKDYNARLELIKQIHRKQYIEKITTEPEPNETPVVFRRKCKKCGKIFESPFFNTLNCKSCRMPRDKQYYAKIPEFLPEIRKNFSKISFTKEDVNQVLGLRYPLTTIRRVLFCMAEKGILEIQKPVGMCRAQRYVLIQQENADML
jgi:hypothetical protein